MIRIANECITNPQKILHSPHTTPVKKIDEVTKEDIKKVANKVKLNTIFLLEGHKKWKR